MTAEHGTGKARQCSAARTGMSGQGAKWLVCFVLGLVCALAFPVFAQAQIDHPLQEKLSQFFREAVAAHRNDLAEEVSRLLKEGKLTSAAQVLDEVPRQSSVMPSAQDLSAALKQGKAQDVLRQGHFVTDREGQLRWVPLSGAERSEIRTLEEMHVSWTSRTFVTRLTKQFIQSLQNGFQHADEVIAKCRALEICNNGQRSAVEAYLSKDQRGFAIGAGRDAGFVGRYIDVREQQGEGVFFYKMCEMLGGALCDHDLVGALMAKAGDVVVFDTPNAALSAYFLAETAATQLLRNGETVMIMIPIEDIRTAVQGIESSAAIGLQSQLQVYSLSNRQN
jgi:hypothetical protein